MMDVFEILSMNMNADIGMHGHCQVMDTFNALREFVMMP